MAASKVKLKVSVKGSPGKVMAALHKITNTEPTLREVDFRNRAKKNA